MAGSGNAIDRDCIAKMSMMEKPNARLFIVKHLKKKSYLNQKGDNTVEFKLNSYYSRNPIALRAYIIYKNGLGVKNNLVYEDIFSFDLPIRQNWGLIGDSGKIRMIAHN
jgi:hypothetical protein